MRVPSKSGSFVVLMAASAVSAFLLPPGWTGWVRGLFQPRALLQRLTTDAARGVEHRAAQLADPPLPPEQARALRAEVEALRRQVVAQGLQLEQQQARLAELTGLAEQALDGSPSIVVAHVVVSLDADPRRQTLAVRLTEKQRPHVRPGQWVVAGLPEDPTREILSRQWLIGQVAEVQTRLARIRLITDPGFKTRARAVRVLADGTWQPARGECKLAGHGPGQMIIEQAEEDYYKAGYRIVVVPASATLPVPLSVGRIIGSRPRDDSPQHVDLLVAPWAPLEQVTVAYLIVLGG